MVSYCVNVFEEFIDFNFRWSDVSIWYGNRVSDLSFVRRVSGRKNDFNYCV